MKIFSISAVVALIAALQGAESFQTLSSIAPRESSSTRLHAYIPSGFTPEQYKKFKAGEEAKKKAAAAKNLGQLGPKGFQSRSFQSFQEALERGEAAHLMPVFNAKERVKAGTLRKEDIPYMQRGGSWDNTDVKGAKNKKKWLSSDKSYASGGYTKEQSVSVFGVGGGLDWTGKKGRSGPAETTPGAAPKFGRNYKPLNVKDIKKGGDDKDKKFFGWF